MSEVPTPESSARPAAWAAVAGVVALLLGGGLVGLAVANVAGEALGRSARLVMAHRLCPWLEIERRRRGSGRNVVTAPSRRWRG